MATTKSVKADIELALKQSDFSPDEPFEVSGPNASGVFTTRFPIVGTRSVSLRSIMQLVGHLRVGKGYKVSNESFKTGPKGVAFTCTLKEKGV